MHQPGDVREAKRGPVASSALFRSARGGGVSTGETGAARAEAREAIEKIIERLKEPAPAVAAAAALPPVVGARVAVGAFGLEGTIVAIHGKQAVCGLRLSDASMRHRTYKTEHRPASLRPTVAAAMERLAGASAGQIVLDPMCGGGTILAEQLALAHRRRAGEIGVLGGDRDADAIRAAAGNLRRAGPGWRLVRWDARRLPLAQDQAKRSDSA